MCGFKGEGFWGFGVSGFWRLTASHGCRGSLTCSVWGFEFKARGLRSFA